MSTEDAQGAEPSPNSKRQRRELNWRMDPEESRSDFTIEIAVLRQTAVTTYRVHKNTLEFGRKASGYFSALFASQTAESMNNKTRIQLNFEPAAKAFPLLLDFMYGLDDGTPALTMENAAPLYHLLDYFEVELLPNSSAILDFWENNMGVENLAVCLEQAEMYRIDLLRKIVVKKCAKNIAAIAVDSPLLNQPHLKFWFDVAKEMNKPHSIGCIHPHFVVVVGEFCYRRKDKLNAANFGTLMRRFTRVAHLCLPPADTVLKLLEVDKAVMPEAIEGNEEELTRQQKWLLHALVWDWECWLDSTVLRDSLKKVSPVLYSYAMDMSCRMAREEKDALAFMLDNAAEGLPTTISVTGAGTTAVNGVYTRCDSFDPAFPKYVMNEEHQATYTISMIRCGPTQVLAMWVWTICKECPQSSTRTHFYYSSAFTNTRLFSLPPRMNGWKPFRNGTGKPTLSYN